jgi:hypothetical protein
MSRNRDDLFRTALQVLAIVFLVLLFATIFHKVFAISRRSHGNIPALISGPPWHAS